MADPESSPAHTGEPAGGPTRSWWSVLAPAAALLLGLVLGGVLVGVVSGDDDDEPSAGPSPTDSPSPAEEGLTPTQSATVIVVPDECLAAADTVEQTLDLLDRSVGAIRDFRPEQLRTLLRELEELDARARAQADACQQIDTSQAP